MFKKSLLLMLVIFLLVIPASALMSAGLLGASYTFQDKPIVALGGEIEVPFISLPIMKTKLVVFAGNYEKIALTEYLIQEVLNIPMTGLYLGVEAGAVQGKFDLPDNLVAIVGKDAIDGGVGVYGAFLGYEHELAPLVKVFGEVGSDFVALSQLPLPNTSDKLADVQVTFLKFGARVGF